MDTKLMCKIIRYINKYGKSTTSDMYITHGLLSERKYTEEELIPAVEDLYENGCIKAIRFKVGKPGYNRYTIIKVTKDGDDFLRSVSDRSVIKRTLRSMWSVIKNHLYI